MDDIEGLLERLARDLAEAQIRYRVLNHLWTELDKRVFVNLMNGATPEGGVEAVVDALEDSDE